MVHPNAHRLLVLVWCIGLFGASWGYANSKKKKGPTPSALAVRSSSLPQPDMGNDNDKKRIAQELVEKAIEQLKERPLKQVCEAITWAPEYKKGEVYLFLYDLKGNLLAHGETPWLLFHNLWDYKDDFGIYFIQSLIQAAMKNSSGLFYTVRWNAALKSIYVRLVHKDGIPYVLCGGYYPYTAPEFVVSFVKGAVQFFKTDVARDMGKSAALGFFNYRSKLFVLGDLYLKVLDEHGKLLVYGLRPNIVGSSVWDVHDERGVFYDREMIKTLLTKPVGAGLWYDYMVNNALKRAYAERVIDAAGHSYFIESGYFPHSDAQQSVVAQEDEVVNLVNAGVRFAQSHTEDEIAQAFSQTHAYKGNPQDIFIRGDLFLFALKPDGTMIISGLNPEDAGRNFWHDQDQDDRFLIQEIIAKVQKRGKTWLAFKRKNAFWSVYGELTHVQGLPVIIGCGFYPMAKMNATTLLVKSAAKYLKHHDAMRAFKAFSKSFSDPNTAFVLGDLSIGVVDTQGFCYADGANIDNIWQNLYDRTDESGKLFMRELIARGQQGPCMVTAHIRGAERLYYAEPMVKDAKTYIVYSAYYPSAQEKDSQSLLLHGATAKELQQDEAAQKIYGVSDTRYLQTPAYKKALAQEPVAFISTATVSGQADMVTTASSNASSAVSAGDITIPDVMAEYKGYVAHKRERVKALVDKGVQMFARNSLAQACNKIMHDPALRDGELFLWLHAMDGTEVVYGDDARFIWQNLYDFKDDFGSYPMRTLLKKALAGGGWHSYRWNKATRTAYVQLVEKDGKQYEIGAAYYAGSKAEEVVSLVNTAATLFDRFIAQGLGKEAAFGVLTHRRGTFMYGNLYLYVLDDAGVTVVHGEKTGLAGEDTWEVKDPTGKLFVQDIITTLRKKPVGQGQWFRYISKNAPKDVFVRRVVDVKGDNFYLVCGFYPETTRAKVTELVTRGYRYLKFFGKTAAKEAFSYENVSVEHPEEAFVYGDISLFLIDFSGKVEIFASMPEYNGKNMLNFKDSTGRYVIKEIIEKLKKQDKAWLDFRIKNGFWNIYVERVDIGTEKLIIGSGFFPVSKVENMHLMVHSAAEYLRTHDDVTAFRALSERDGVFERGDLNVFALDAAGGTCFVWGSTYDIIWKNLARKADQHGRMYIQALIDATHQEPVVLGSYENNAPKMYYAESVMKGDNRYVVGSGYYP